MLFESMPLNEKGPDFLPRSATDQNSSLSFFVAKYIGFFFSDLALGLVMGSEEMKTNIHRNAITNNKLSKKLPAE